MKRFLLITLFALAVPAVVLAKETTALNVVVPADAVVNDNYVRVGQTVEINGTVNGDVMVAAQSVVINGTVAGDVIAAAETVRIRGPVAGNVRVAASTVTIDAAVGKNATVFASTIEVTKRATIGWSAQLFAASIDLDGIVSGNVNAYGASATLRGSIKGDALFVLDDEGALRLSPTASVGRDLEYHSNIEATIDQGANVSGVVRMVKQTGKQGVFDEFTGSLVSLWRLAKLFGLLVVGLVLLSILPKTSTKIVGTMRSKPWISFAVGLVGLVVVPIAAVILMVTIIGIAAALIALALYLIALYVAEVYVSLFLGTWILGLIRKNKPSPALWAFILGAVIFSALTMIPWLGWFLKFIGVLFALGALLRVKWGSLRKIEEAA